MKLTKRPETYREIVKAYDIDRLCPFCNKPSGRGMTCTEHRKKWEIFLDAHDDSGNGVYLEFAQGIYDTEIHPLTECPSCSQLFIVIDDYLCTACRAKS